KKRANRVARSDQESCNKPDYHVAKPAEHADHENERAERIADERMDVILQNQKTGGETGQGAADRRSDEIDVPLIDAHQADYVAVLSDCAYSRTDKCSLEKKIKRHCAGDRHCKCQ